MANVIRFQISILSFAVFTIIGVLADGPASVGGIGAQCDRRSKLCIKDAICHDDSTCRCGNGFVPDQSQQVCLAETTEWNGDCTDDNQCSKFEGAKCINNHCDCQPGHHFLDAKCWTTRRLKEECNYNNECLLLPHTDRIECFGGKCECKEGYHITPTGDDCSGASELWKLGLSTLLVIQIIKSLLI